MRRSRLLGWIPPVIIVLAIGVYAGAVASGRWRDPAPGEPGAVKAYPESTDPGHRKARAELCPLINRPDVLELVEQPATVKGVGTSYHPDGDWHQCTVSLTSSTLRLNVWHGRITVADYLKLLGQGEAEPRTVLGRSAVWTTAPSIVVNSPLKGATLLVAWDRADSGGMVELTILREGTRPGDEDALTRIAERQLPGLPGWPA